MKTKKNKKPKNPFIPLGITDEFDNFQLIYIGERRKVNRYFKKIGLSISSFINNENKID